MVTRIPFLLMRRKDRFLRVFVVSIILRSWMQKFTLKDIFTLTLLFGIFGRFYKRLFFNQLYKTVSHITKQSRRGVCRNRRQMEKGFGMDHSSSCKKRELWSIVLI